MGVSYLPALLRMDTRRLDNTALGLGVDTSAIRRGLKVLGESFQNRFHQGVCSTGRLQLPETISDVVLPGLVAHLFVDVHQIELSGLIGSTQEHQCMRFVRHQLEVARKSRKPRIGRL